MSETAEYIIIGGGVMGASIAYHLARSGNGRVVLLERQALCTGTTGRSGAIVRQHYSNDFTVRMAQQSLHVFQNFEEIVGGDCGFITTGMLVVTGEDGSEALTANVALQQEQGVPIQMIHPNEIGEIAAGFSGIDAVSACYESNAGVADPMATTHCFAQRARDYGAHILEGITVTRIVTEGERVIGVETPRGSFWAPNVILAANVWSVELAAAIKIALPITATRHPMLALRRPNDAGGSKGIHAVCLDMQRSIYLRPEASGITLIGSCDNVLTPSNPDQYAQGLTESEIAHLRREGGARMPALTRAVPRGSWAGIYDNTPDYHPILGRLPGYEGLYGAAGFSGHGFKLSPIVGQWMATLITAGQEAEDMQNFRYERFTLGQEIRPRYSSGVLG